MPYRAFILRQALRRQTIPSAHLALDRNSAGNHLWAILSLWQSSQVAKTLKDCDDVRMANQNPSEPTRDHANDGGTSNSGRETFTNRKWLQNGGGIAIFLVLLVALRVLQYFVFTKRLPHDWMMSPGGMLAEEAVRVLVVLLVTSLLAMLERRRPTDYGLGGVRAIRLCFAGGAWGFATLSLLVGALKLTGALTFNGPEMSASAALGLGLRWLLAFFAVAFFEEMALRGYLQYALARITGFWWAALIWSVVFLLMHGTNGGEGIVGLIQTGWIALFFCLSLWLTGSLWWAIGFHAAWDWSESYFYGTADSGVNVTGHLFSAVPHGNPLLSGGSTGPEGSILALLVLAIPTIALWLTYRGAKELRWKAVR